MSDIDDFVVKYGGLSESYFFYNGEIEIVYDKEAHTYMLVKDGELFPRASVTTILHKTIDKSKILVPWGCKEMEKKLLATVPNKPDLHDGKLVVATMYRDTFEKLVATAKNAHREKFEDAGALGHIAHSWIENHIKLCISHSNIPFINGCPLPYDERAANACKAALDWMKAHNVRWISTETKVYSKIHEVPGTTDGRAWVDSCNDDLCCPKPFKDKLSIIDWKTSNHLYLEYLFQIAFYSHAWMEEHPEDKIEDFWVIRLGKDDAEFNAWHVATEDELELYYFGFLNCLRTYRSIVAAEGGIQFKQEWLRAERKKRRNATS